MLLVIDIGNTNIVLGIFHGDKFVRDWRIRTEKNITEDEFNLLVVALFAVADVTLNKISKVVISCVVPPMITILDAFCNKYLKQSAHWVGPDSVKKCMPILYHNPREVGADRIVNAVAAYQKYKCSLIVIDFGTATTFDVISDNGEYLGGTICPGVMISSNALFHKASQLPRVEIFVPPATVIGKDTAHSIKSGIIYGNAGLVDGMVKRISKEMEVKPKVIATGGLATLIAGVSETIESVDRLLTLEGLRIISHYSDDYLKSINGMEDSIIKASKDFIGNYVTEDKLDW